MASKRFPRVTGFRVGMQKSFCCFFLYWAFLLTLSVVNAADEPKKALIFGITGQDGTYLTEFLLSKNYEVHGPFEDNPQLRIPKDLIYFIAKY